MMKMNMRIANLVAACAAVMCAWGAECVGIVGLQVNHLAEPRHVGAQPLFGWRMETARAGARCTGRAPRRGRPPPARGPAPAAPGPGVPPPPPCP